MFQPLLVCGYSLEVNATTDMDYCLSIHQIELLYQIYANNIRSIIDAVTMTTTTGHHKHQRPDPREVDLSMDSGVESEVSTLKSVQMRMMEPSTTSSDQNKPFDWTSLTPFDILLTAGKISFMLYMVEERKPQIKIVDVGSGMGYPNVKMLSVPMIIVPGTSNIGGGSRSPTPSTQHVIKPFMYAYFSQPHSLIACHQDSQKMVLSCFDVILKGCKDGYLISDVGKVIPEHTDYMVHWIETRPGKPDPKTGVPPSLYTLTIINMFRKPGV